jgi:hypothetical protein
MASSAAGAGRELILHSAVSTDNNVLIVIDFMGPASNETLDLVCRALYTALSRYFGDGTLEKREKAEAAFSAAELSAAVARTATYFDFSGLPRGWSGSPRC